jgi:ferredoxin-NADP reductase
MAEIKVGTTIFRRDLSPILTVFRLIAEPGNKFPTYKAGQYVALRRENCRLTKRTALPNGRVQYLPDLDEHGVQRRGPVTHSYSISSAPFETALHGYLEFYVILELDEKGIPGRLTESLFQLDPSADKSLTYFTKIAGEFTAENITKGFENVVMVGTGTGLAPFASMIKQADFDASNGIPARHRFTLFHANRGFNELGYHGEFLHIEREQKIDFVYVPSISRPEKEDYGHASIGKGRANNLLRSVLKMRSKEEEDLDLARSNGADIFESENRGHRAVPAQLPTHHSAELLRDRMPRGSTIVLTCGNPRAMADIETIANANNLRFEKEEW